VTDTDKIFSDVLAEAAWHCLDSAHADDDFTDPAGHRNSISEVGAQRLRDLGCHDLAERYVNEYQPSAGGHLVWIRDTDAGVEVVEFGTDDGLRSGTDRINQAYDLAKSTATN